MKFSHFVITNCDYNFTANSYSQDVALVSHLPAFYSWDFKKKVGRNFYDDKE